MTAVEMMSSDMDVKTTAPVSTKPVVVASDGSDTALAALRVADLIHDRTGCTVRVVSALEPLPVILPPVEGVVIPPNWEKVREQGRRDMVAAQLKPFASSFEWALDVIFGKPCEAIASYAREHNAGLIIVGSNKHGVIDRLLGEDTAVDIARLSDVPLLIASPEMDRLPKRILVAMDLDPDGMQTTAQTLKLLADTSTVSCAHVQPRDEFLGVDWAQYDSEYRFAMDERFASVDKALLEAGLRADHVALHGNPAKEIVDLAAYSRAELITVGIKRKIGKTKAIGGRTARRIIRGAECSVLIVPNVMPRVPGAKVPGSTDVIDDSRQWDTAMRAFTARNAGRIVSLEVDDPEIGAIMEASNYPLIGVDYDRHDRSLGIFLGEMQGVERHLVRTITNPKTVSILSGDDERDLALAVTHDGGQTLLTF